MGEDERRDPLASRPSGEAARRRWRTAAMAAGAVLAGVAAILAAGLLALKSGAAAGPLRALLEAKLGREVGYSHVAVTRAPEGLRLVFTDLRIGQPARFGPGDLARAPRVEIVVRLAPLLAGRVEAPEVTLTSPELHLRRHGPGDDNWTFGKGGGTSSVLGATRTLRITDGRLTWDDPQRRLTLAGAFSHDPALADLPLRLDGAGVLQGEPFRAQAQAGPLNGRAPHAPHALRLQMQDGATRVRLDGRTQAPFDFRGLDMDVQAAGPNLADLIYLFNLTAPNSPPFRLSGHMHREAKRFDLTRLDARLGDSDVRGEITSDHLQRRRIDARLRSHRLTAADLRVLLASPPPHAVARVRPGDAGHGGGAASGRVFSATPISFRRLQGGDTTLAYHADTATGFGPPVTAADLRLAIRDGRLSLAPLTFDAAGGAVRVDYALDTDAKVPAARLGAQVRGLQLARAGAGAGVGGRLDGEVEVRGAGVSAARQAATATGRASLRLTAADLPKRDAAALSGDLLGLVGSLLDPKGAAPLRCVTADFALASGVARATRLVVGTSKGSATGGGEVDLRDERLDLRLEASARGREPLVQLRVPILIDGALNSPRVHAKAPPVASGASDLLRSIKRIVAGRPSGPPAPSC